MGRHGNQNPPRQIRVIENRLIGHHPETGQVWSQVVEHPDLVDILEWKRDPETSTRRRASSPSHQYGYQPQSPNQGGNSDIGPPQPGAVTRTLTIRRLPEWQIPALPEWAIGGVCYVFCRFHLECFRRYQNVQKRRNGLDPPHGSGIICGHSVAVRQTNC